MNLNFLLKFLRKNRFYAIINLAGLSLGIACWWLISVYVRNELNYDGYQQNKHRIYRLTSAITVQGKLSQTAGSSPATGAALLKNYPEVERTATFEIQSGNKLGVRYRNRIFPETGFYKATKDVFNIFSYRLLEGDPHTALERPASVVLTKTLAKKYFGDEDPLGKPIYINNELHQVTGILQDLPPNSDLYFTGLISLDLSKIDDLFDLSYYTYILVNDKANGYGGQDSKAFVKRLDTQLAAVSDKLFNQPLKSAGQDIRIDLHAQPMAGMHFDNSLLTDTPKSERSYLYIFPLVGLFILLIVGINYMNLSIAQSAKRSREIAVKKVSGATIRQLFLQFVQESLFMVCLALVLASCLAMAAIPLFNNITGKGISLSELFEGPTLLILVGLCLSIGIISSVYPAMYLSRLNPVSVFKSNFTRAGRNHWLRPALIILQFVISNGMIACSVIAYNHLRYLEKKELGFNKSQLLVVNVPDDSTVYSGTVAFRNALEQRTSIGHLAFGGIGSLPGGKTLTGSANIESDTGKRIVVVNSSVVDEQYTPLLGITIVKGRNFDKAPRSDSNFSVLVNETLVREIGWKNPIGKMIDANGRRATIIGVIKDYHYTSLHNKLEPLVVYYKSESPSYIFLRAGAGDLASIAAEWHKAVPQYAFDYRFVDQVFADEYKRDQRLMTLFSSFCVIAVFAACIGLFGLFSMNVGERVKEICIRKVLGGSAAGAIYLLSKNFLLNIFIAIPISTAVAWYCMALWERDFAYHEKITIAVFLFSAALSILLALATIVFQALKASRSNPARVLRSE